MDESDYDEFSLNLLSSNNKKEVIIKKNRKKEGIYKNLGDNKKGILLDNNKHILKLV